MRFPRSLTSVLRSAVAGAAVVAAFATGVVVGVSGNGHGSSSTSARATVAPTAASSPRAAVDPLAQARQVIESDAATSVSSTNLDAAAIKAMLASLDDPWASYHPAGSDDATSATLDGSYAGLGLWLRAQAGGAVQISSVLPGSAAARGGLAAGDELLSVAGKPARGVALEDVLERLRGSVGSRVAVTTRTSAGRLRTATLTRVELAVDDASVQRLPGGILVARVASFSQGVGTALRNGIAGARRLGSVQGIVLDLRGNPGGLLSEGVAVASQFLNGGNVVSYVRRGQPTQILKATSGGDNATPLAVLVDGGTASAAEVVAGALQDRHRGLLVGTKTFGKGTVQEPVRLSDGSMIELTVGHYATPGGRSLDGVGLTPDIAVPPTVATGTPSDPALSAAETVVGSLLADAGTKAGTGRG